MARTKAAKLQAKRSRGRPKKDVPLREPNGRASRMKEDPAKVAMEARMRHYGVPSDMARDPRTGSYLGRLAMAGRGDGISQDQYEAATRYIDLYNSYQKATQRQARRALLRADFCTLQLRLADQKRRLLNKSRSIRLEQSTLCVLLFFAARSHSDADLRTVAIST